MIGNTKEYIVCAAYRQSKNTSNRRKVINDIGKDPKSIYYAPHNEVFDLRLGYRHPDIIYQYGDEIDQSDGGGFMTSKGRYVDRTEAMTIAYECGQVTKETAVRDDGNGQYGSLFSEDIY